MFLFDNICWNFTVIFFAKIGMIKVQKASNHNIVEAIDSSRSPFLQDASQNVPTGLLGLVDRAEPSCMAFVRAIGRDVLETARDGLSLGLVIPVLVGETAIIKADAEAIGWNLDSVRIVHAEGEKEAIEIAILLVAGGEVSGLIKGQLHSDVFMGSIIRRESGIRTKRRMLHIFAMLPPNGGRALLISDAAVNVSPNVETRVEAALQMAALARLIGVARPKVAVLSATESLLPAIPSSIEADQIAKLASNADDKADFAGPLSFDLALSPASVAAKGISKDSAAGLVAGKADALVVPEIVSGNILFKSLAYCAGGLAAGIVVGGKVPIVLTSRSDPPPARLASIALAALTNS